MTVTSGKRLEKFVRQRWGREQGGIRGLAGKLHVAPDKVYAWFKGTDAPDTDELEQLASLLAVKRYQIVAAMDGEDVLALDDQGRVDLLTLMDEWAVSRGLRVPRPGSGKGTDAA